MVKKTLLEKEFLRFVKDQCKKYGIKCKLKNVSYLKLSGNIKCSGYFCETEKVLAVAMDRADWIEILAHEYCHLTQWVDGVDVWEKGCTGLVKMDNWMNGSRVRDIKKYLGYVRDLELDNEKRAVTLIKKWGLDVDLDMYIKKANAYVQFYNYIYHTRKWSSPKNSPYSNGNVVESMSNKFNMKYSDMSSRVYKVFTQEKI
jgi:hypothetical protein